MFVYIMIASGVCWIITYLLIIKQSFAQRTYGMPMAALCANISWEAIFSFIHPHPTPYLYTNYVWFLFDAVIFYQLLAHWRNDHPTWKPIQFYLNFAVTLVSAFCLVLFITHEFKDWFGPYTAFGQNFMMSILFINMLNRRNSLSGQSLGIAVFKMLGTALASIGFCFLFPDKPHQSPLFLFLYIATFVADLVYINLVYRMQTK